MKWINLLIVMTIFSGSANADNFQPTLLTISADPMIHYDFDGAEIDIPVTVSGTPAGVIFCLFTKDRANDIPYTVNGYLGWHQVNKVDTCVYYSQMYDFDIGENTIIWDGRDNDGNWIQMGAYTYYLWGYDNKSNKQRAGKHLNADWGFDMVTSVQEVDESGLPMANPIWYMGNERWILGSDPEDESLKITTSITLPEGWVESTRHGNISGNPLLHPDDFDYQYMSIATSDDGSSSIIKLKFVPDGEAEIVEDWGEDAPFATRYDYIHNAKSAGVTTDGTYLFTLNGNYVTSNDPDSGFYIYDMEGFLVESVDLSPWWSSADDYEAGGQMNGGPNNFFARGGIVFLGCHCNCLTQMIDPRRFLESGEFDDLFVWTNGNGDYVLDKNFEQTAQRPWTCNDYNVAPYSSNISADANLFVTRSVIDLGPVSFGLLAPDGTGLGYFAFGNETAGKKYGQIIIDSDTPFDGIYCDDESHGPHPIINRNYDEDELPDGIYFIAQDSVKGLLVYNGDCFQSWPHVSIYKPNEGDILVKGQKNLITLSICSSYPIKIEYSADGGESWLAIDEVLSEYSPLITWNVPDIESDKCYLRATLLDYPDYPVQIVGPFSIVSDDVSVSTSSPYTFSTSSNHPNPFNPITSIPFTLATESEITLTVYNTAGEKVATLADGNFSAGRYSLDWNASEFASGVYFYRLTAGDFVETRKMMLVK